MGCGTSSDTGVGATSTGGVGVVAGGPWDVESAELVEGSDKSTRRLGTALGRTVKTSSMESSSTVVTRSFVWASSGSGGGSVAFAFTGADGIRTTMTLSSAGVAEASSAFSEDRRADFGGSLTMRGALLPGSFTLTP